MTVCRSTVVPCVKRRRCYAKQALVHQIPVLAAALALPVRRFDARAMDDNSFMQGKVRPAALMLEHPPLSPYGRA